MSGLIRAIQIAVFILCLLVSHVSFSIDSIQVFVDGISFEPLLSPSAKTELKKKQPAFKLDKLSISLDLLSKPVKLHLDLAKLDLPEPYKSITSLDISCPDFLFMQNSLECDNGRLSFAGLFATEKRKEITDQNIISADFSVHYNAHNNKLKLAVDNLNLGAGKISFNYQLVNNKWHTDFSAKGLEYNFFKEYITHYLNQADRSDIVDRLKQLRAKFSFSGNASGLLADNSEAEGRLDAIKIKGQLSDINYEFGDDLAEKLALGFSFNLTQSINKKTQEGSGNYQGLLAIDAHKGEIIQNDIYVVLNGKERLRSQFNYRSNQSIDFSRLDINSKGFFDFKSKAKVLLKNELIIDQLDSQMEIKNLSEFNQSYLNNVLSGSDYEELQVEGGVSLRAEKNQEKINLKTVFKDFSVQLNEEISLINLNANINWNNHKQKSSPVAPSQLSWQELTLNHLPFDASSFNFILHNDYLKLTQETDIPIFDGALHINSLQVSQLFPQLNDPQNLPIEQPHKGLTLTIDGYIKPLSLGLLSSHFEWPLLDGTLSAVIPKTTYNEKYLSVGGALMLQVFGGVIIIKDLRIVEPLKDYAQLFANIDLNNLNLKSLTKTYNFGEIDGRLEGKFSELELSAWEPVAFDAYIRTPDNDKSSHRISQRAIDNLSSLGGASGLLSRSFLSFFETFRYDKIGLSCKLANNVCQMSGVEAKGNSYYIVKGGGIPRIDVMGFQRQVNWRVLTSRLQAIQSANEAVIK